MSNQVGAPRDMQAMWCSCDDWHTYAHALVAEGKRPMLSECVSVPRIRLEESLLEVRLPALKLT